MSKPAFEPPGILGDRGFLIAVEGIDGAGKTTQVRAIQARMDAIGFDVVTSKEPTHGPWGQKLRESSFKGRMSPEEELDAFVQDRKEHCERVLRPALAQGKLVIVDRYYFSTAAYQGARGMNVDEILAQNEAFAPQPDVLVILDADVSLALGRVRSRDGEGNLFEKQEDLEKSRKIFQSIQRPYKLMVSGEDAPEMVTANILRAIFNDHLFKRLCLKSHYKSECEPAYCSFRLDGSCRWVRLGQLDPVERSGVLPRLAAKSAE